MPKYETVAFVIRDSNVVWLYRDRTVCEKINEQCVRAGFSASGTRVTRKEFLRMSAIIDWTYPTVSSKARGLAFGTADVQRKQLCEDSSGYSRALIGNAANISSVPVPRPAPPTAKCGNP